jgi:hypothetical protein
MHSGVEDSRRSNLLGTLRDLASGDWRNPDTRYSRKQLLLCPNHPLSEIDNGAPLHVKLAFTPGEKIVTTR